MLWYFNTFKDWDINNGTKPNEDDILVYGGQGDSELRPHYVQANQWHVASDMSQGYAGKEDYIPVELMIKCADGSETERPAPQNNMGSRPLLTDAEMDRQYAVVYKRAAKHAAREDDVNLVRRGLCVLCPCSQKGARHTGTGVTVCVFGAWHHFWVAVLGGANPQAAPAGAGLSGKGAAVVDAGVLQKG